MSSAESLVKDAEAKTVKALRQKIAASLKREGEVKALRDNYQQVVATTTSLFSPSKLLLLYFYIKGGGR